MTSNAILRRIELLEKEIASPHKPKLVFCWTRTLGDKIQHALGPQYVAVSIRGIAGCANDDEVEALVRETPSESERLDKLLAGIPPD
jgi:hypothetical protein